MPVTIRSAFVYEANDSFPCWHCQGTTIKTGSLPEDAEARLICPDCNMVYVIAGGDDPAWMTPLLDAGGLNGMTDASPLQTAVAALIRACDQNAPISDLLQTLRDQLKRSGGEKG